MTDIQPILHCNMIIIILYVELLIIFNWSTLKLKKPFQCHQK